MDLEIFWVKKGLPEAGGRISVVMKKLEGLEDSRWTKFEMESASNHIAKNQLLVLNCHRKYEEKI